MFKPSVWSVRIEFWFLSKSRWVYFLFFFLWRICLKKVFQEGSLLISSQIWYRSFYSLENDFWDSWPLIHKDVKIHTYYNRFRMTFYFWFKWNSYHTVCVTINHQLLTVRWPNFSLQIMPKIEINLLISISI